MAANSRLPQRTREREANRPQLVHAEQRPTRPSRRDRGSTSAQALSARRDLGPAAPAANAWSPAASRAARRCEFVANSSEERPARGAAARGHPAGWRPKPAAPRARTVPTQARNTHSPMRGALDTLRGPSGHRRGATVLYRAERRICSLSSRSLRSCASRRAKFIVVITTTRSLSGSTCTRFPPIPVMKKQDSPPYSPSHHR
jgi:hypothetical protein